jgi:hypothetical protein
MDSKELRMNRPYSPLQLQSVSRLQADAIILSSTQLLGYRTADILYK